MGQCSTWLRRARLTTVARLATLVLVGGVVTAVLLGSSRATKRAPQAGAVSAGTAQLAAPDFQLTAAPFVGGGQFVLSQHADKPTVLYGMAAWCGSCIGQARTLVQLKRELGDRFNLVVVDIDPNDTEANLRGFAHAAGGPLGFWGVDRAGAITRPYHILYLHTTIVIRDGREWARSLEDEPLDRLRAAVTDGSAGE